MQWVHHSRRKQYETLFSSLPPTPRLWTLLLLVIRLDAPHLCCWLCDVVASKSALFSCGVSIIFFHPFEQQISSKGTAMCLWSLAMAAPNFALNDVDMFAPVLHLKNKRDYSRYLAEGRKKCFFSCLRFPVRPGGFYEIAKSNWQVSSCSAKKTLEIVFVSCVDRDHGCQIPFHWRHAGKWESHQGPDICSPFSLIHKKKSFNQTKWYLLITVLQEGNHMATSPFTSLNLKATCNKTESCESKTNEFILFYCTFSFMTTQDFDAFLKV